MPPPPSFGRSPSPAPFHCARADKQHRSRGAHAPELCPRRRTTTKKQTKKREAERREAHPAMAVPPPYPPPLAGGGNRRGLGAGRADKCTQSAPLNLLEARSPFGAPLRRLPKRANAPAQPGPRFTRTRGCGRYPHRHSRLSKAPCAPVVMPAGHSSGHLPVCIRANCVHCF